MDVKTILFDYCGEWVKEKLELAKSTLDQLDQSSGNETKSSAGDKYETGREMIQLERNKVVAQLEEAQKLTKALQTIEDQRVDDATGMGKIYETDKGMFFISLPIGKMQIDGLDCFAISPISPIGQKLISSSIGQTVQVNNLKYKIINIS